jgi:hypothetical protein
MKQMSAQRPTELASLAVWLLIAGVLAAALLLFRHLEARRVHAQLEEDRQKLGHAVESYKIAFDFLPQTLDDLLRTPSGKNRKAPPVLAALPLDPWGHPYRYERSAYVLNFLATAPDGKEAVLEWDVKPLVDRLYRAKLLEVLEDFETISASVERHRGKDGRPPLNLPDDVAKVLDPWGNAYSYNWYQGPGEDFCIYSYGSDGCPGGQGEEADLSSANRPLIQKLADSLAPRAAQ